MTIEFPSLIGPPPVIPVPVTLPVQTASVPLADAVSPSTTTVSNTPLQTTDSATTAALQNLLQTWIAGQTGSAVQSIDVHNPSVTLPDPNPGYNAQGILTGNPAYLVTQGLAHMSGGQNLGFSLQLQLPPGYPDGLQPSWLGDLFGQYPGGDFATLQSLLDIGFNSYDALLNGNALPAINSSYPTADSSLNQNVALAQLAGNYDNTILDAGNPAILDATAGLGGVDVLI